MAFFDTAYVSFFGMHGSDALYLSEVNAVTKHFVGKNPKNDVKVVRISQYIMPRSDWTKF